jgi:hypothetical protein
MPNPLNVLPDDELALLTYLRGISAVTALVSAAKIIQQLPPTPAYPYVLLQRAGGQSPEPPKSEGPPRVVRRP